MAAATALLPHVNHILAKAACGTGPQAVSYAYRTGLADTGGGSDD